jgi:23S rRNA (cytosine1962-C5)-methyltransferase
MQPAVTISARGEQRVRGGHPWIYRADVVDVDAEGGDIVQVIGPRNRLIGRALYSDQSQIAIRMLTRGDAEADLPLLHSRLDAAIAVREALQLDATAYRLVHAEADLLPSLVVDRYDRYIVVQTLSQGMNRLLPELTAMLVAIAAPAGILARNDPKVRVLEGLDQTVEVLHGDVPESIVAREGPVEYEVDLRKGQKTGLFLDQRENREAAARYARGRLLDCFSYNGGFALRLARQCPEAEAIDISADAVSRIRANAARNGVPHLEAREANVFDELRRLERAGARYDTIVLDPPAFAKNKAAIPNALAGYKEINLRAMRLLSPGGHLITCSCSYNVNEEMFGAVLEEASADSHTPVAIVEKRMQGRDHPVLVGVPETYYLKCFILRRVE